MQLGVYTDLVNDDGKVLISDVQILLYVADVRISS